MMSRHIPQESNNNHSNDSSNQSENQKNSMNGKSQKSLHEEPQPGNSQMPEEHLPEEKVARQVGLGKNAEGFQRTVIKSPNKHNTSEEILRNEDESSLSSHSSVSPISSQSNIKSNVPEKRPLMQVHQTNVQYDEPVEEQKSELVDRTSIMAAAASSIEERYESNGMRQHHVSLYENIAAQHHTNDIIHQQIARERERARQNSMSKQFSSSQFFFKTSSNGAGGFYNDHSLSHENNNGFINNANNENSLMMNAPAAPHQSSHQNWSMMQNNHSFGSNEEHYQYQQQQQQRARGMSQSNAPASLFQNNSSQNQQSQNHQQQQQQLSKNFHNSMTSNYNMGAGQSNNIQSSFDFGNNFSMRSHYDNLHGHVSGGSSASGFPPLVSLISPRPQQQTQINESSGGGGPLSTSQMQNMGGFVANDNYNSYQNHQQSNMLFNNHNNNTQHSPFDPHNYHKYLSNGRGGMGTNGVAVAANDNNLNHSGTNNNNSGAYGMMAVPPSHLQTAIGSNTSQYEDNQIIAGSSLSPNLIASAAASTNRNMLH